MKIFGWHTNIAGRQRYSLTLVGLIIVLIIVWILGAIFMPKNNSEEIAKKIVGYWNCKTENENIRMQIKESGYFYYDIITLNKEPKYFKGIITKAVKDTLTIISFKGDTLLQHTIIELNNHLLKLKNIQNSSLITFTK